MKKLRSSRGGFTLIELLIVIFIIVILGSVVLIQIQEFRKKGRNGGRLQIVQQHAIALQTYYSRFSGFPQSLPQTSSCLGILPSENCMSGKGTYSGSLSLNNALKEFLPYGPAVKDPVYGIENGATKNYDGFLYTNTNTSECSASRCQDVEIQWYLEGTNQSCGIGYRTSCGVTGQITTITGCMLHLPTRTTDQNSC